MPAGTNKIVIEVYSPSVAIDGIQGDSASLVDVYKRQPYVTAPLPAGKYTIDEVNVPAGWDTEELIYKTNPNGWVFGFTTLSAAFDSLDKLHVAAVSEIEPQVYTFYLSLIHI